MTVRVVTVDDQAVFRRAAAMVIESSPGFELAGEAESGEMGIEVVEQLDPDLVLMDVRMPGLDGVETARRITDRWPEIVIVLVSVTYPRLTRAQAGFGAAPLVAKRDLGPSLLRELWIKHGPELAVKRFGRG